MKKIICDICKREVSSVDEIEVPKKVTEKNNGYVTENEKIDICKECHYELKLQNTLDIIKAIKKLRKKERK